jgi:hypothetical protein
LVEAFNRARRAFDELQITSQTCLGGPGALPARTIYAQILRQAALELPPPLLRPQEVDRMLQQAAEWSGVPLVGGEHTRALLRLRQINKMPRPSVDGLLPKIQDVINVLPSLPPRSGSLRDEELVNEFILFVTSAHERLPPAPYHMQMELKKKLNTLAQRLGLEEDIPLEVDPPDTRSDGLLAAMLAQEQPR